jgi:hypothetical protein
VQELRAADVLYKTSSPPAIHLNQIKNTILQEKTFVGLLGYYHIISISVCIFYPIITEEFQK